MLIEGCYRWYGYPVGWRAWLCCCFTRIVERWLCSCSRGWWHRTPLVRCVRLKSHSEVLLESVLVMGERLRADSGCVCELYCDEFVRR